jgi:tetratricopeptide (TPR) repeat protein
VESTDRQAKRVFISYATQDREIAEAARDRIEREGMSAWMAPRDIHPGEDYGTAIIDAINSAQVMVVVLSRSSDASPAVRREVERAFSKRVFLIPYKIEEFTLGKGLEFFLAAPQWINVAGMPREKAGALLANGVKAALAAAAGQEGVPAAAPVGGSAAGPSVSMAKRLAVIGGVAAAAAILIGVGVLAGRGKIDLVRRAQAYESIQQGKVPDAEAYLDALLREGSAGDKAFATAGKAAGQLLQGNAREAAALIAKAREISKDCALCDVLEADLLLMDGKIEASQALYRAALERQKAAPCEKAAAAAGLGRSLSSSGKGEEALKLYAQALDADPGNSRALTGRASVLAGMGKYEEAIAGMKGHDGDSYVAQYLRALTRDMELRRSAEQKDRISRLVDDLVKQYRERPGTGRAEDGWTSRPTAVCFFETSAQGGPSYREGEDGMLVARVQDALLENGRFGVVEREDLDRVLQELKIATSGAADPESAVRYGKLKTAGVLIYTTAARRGGLTALSFKAVNTETSEILGRVSVEIPAVAPADAFQQAADKVFDLLAKTYPVRGRVAEVSGGGVELNIGSRVGVKPGMVFNLIGPDDAPGAAGTIRVTQAGGATSRAEVIKAAPAPRKGDRVESAL